MAKFVRLRRRSLLRRSFVLSADDLARRVVSGASYKFLGIALRTVITIGSTAILARMLSPSEFGYIAMAAVITEFAGLFGTFGFTEVLVQRRVVNRLQVDTVFWASLGIGTALTLIVLLLSAPAGWLFGDPQVVPLVQVLCLTFVLNSLTAVPWAVLSRLLQFRTEFWVQTSTVLFRSAVAVGCAFSGFGVWSLVAGSIAGSLASVVLHFVAVPYSPRPRIHLSYIVDTWRTSSFYFFAGLLYYVNMNFDLILVGRNFGAATLGFYQNARSLTDEIRARIAAPLQNILFPAFSTVQQDKARLQDIFMRSGRLLATAIFPLGFGVSATAQELVLTLYGINWLPMVPLTVLFGISAAVRGATAIATPLLNARNRVGLALKYNIINTALMVVGVAATISYGVQAVAAAVALASFYPLMIYRVAISHIGLSTVHMIKILFAPTAAAALMWIAIGLSRSWVASHVDLVPIRLLIFVGLGAIVYAFALWAFSRQHLTDAKTACMLLLNRN